MKAKWIVFIVLVIFIVVLLIFNNKRLEKRIDNQNEHYNENIESENNMDEFISKINVNINGANYKATLEDNPTTREFIKRLPLEINMDELNGNEKYYYFDSSLPSKALQVGKINSGDLMLYGSDCLVLFYESFNTSYSYTKIGRIDNPSSLKEQVGRGSVRIAFSR